MSTGEGQDPRTGPAPRDRDERGRGGEKIGVGGGDDSVSRIQLAARWAEAFGRDGDSLTSALKRFRTAYEYLDAVIHGVDPPELPDEDPQPAPSVAAPGYAPPQQPSAGEPAPTPRYAAPQQPWAGGPGSAPAPTPGESAPPPPWARPPEPGAQPAPPPPSEPRPWS
ncbi:MAG: hypothetical protein JO057_13940 [Chloroflexi bacterium]|nr:hypothetical protein [Chloroflexota bacterium]